MHPTIAGDLVHMHVPSDGPQCRGAGLEARLNGTESGLSSSCAHVAML